MSDLAPSAVTAPITVTAGAPVDDTVSVITNGQTITGWTEVRITRRAEGIPNDFDVALTANNPSDNSQVVAQRGQSCVVKIGRNTVITGYIDRDTNEGDADNHRLGIIGRGKCSDLVDCSAEWKGGQISGSSALQIASKLAEPYGITVVQAPGLNIDRVIPQFNLNFGETAQAIIDRVCTYGGYLYYEDEVGDLLLSQVGVTAAASGFVYGQNVQTWSVQNSLDQRYSDYVCAAVSVDTFQDTGDGGLLYFTAYDKEVLRHRLMYLVAESVTGSLQLCEDRALWEAARRAGRGTSVKVTADSWRDTSGTLWTPNTLAPVTVPGLRLPPASQLVISEVTLVYNEERGKVAEVSLLPQAAFALQPTQIQPTSFGSNELTPGA